MKHVMAPNQRMHPALMCLGKLFWVGQDERVRQYSHSVNDIITSRISGLKPKASALHVK